MYAQFDYGLTDHVVRLRKISLQKERENRVDMERPKKKVRRKRDRSDYLGTIFLNQKFWENRN